LAILPFFGWKPPAGKTVDGTRLSRFQSIFKYCNVILSETIETLLFENPLVLIHVHKFQRLNVMDSSRQPRWEVTV
jgi:hypothetical protein